MRRMLLVLLGFGIFAGYSSAFASARWHARHGPCGGWDRDRWEQSNDRREAPAVTPVVAPAPQTVIVPQAAPAPAAPPAQVFVITVPTSAPQAAPQIITVPVPAAAMQAAPQAAAPTP